MPKHSKLKNCKSRIGCHSCSDYDCFLNGDKKLPGCINYKPILKIISGKKNELTNIKSKQATQ